VRLSKVAGIFVTHNGPEAICGLPGAAIPRLSCPRLRSKLTDLCTVVVGLALTAFDAGRTSLDIVGMPGLQTFWNSTSHFMRLNESYISIREVAPPQLNVPPSTRLKYGDIEVIAVPIVASSASASTSFTPLPSSSATSSASLDKKYYGISYVCQTPTLPGKFDVQRAATLNIPKGPMYAQLKNGKSVTLANGDIILPDQVLGPPQVGRNVAVLCALENEDAVAAVSASFDWSRYDIRCYQFVLLASSSSLHTLRVFSLEFDCVVHLSSGAVTSAVSYQQWLESAFNKSCTHIFVGAGNCAPESSFIAATTLTNKLHDAIPSLFCTLGNTETSSGPADTADLHATEPNATLRCVAGVPLMKYVLLPMNVNGLAIPTVSMSTAEDAMEVGDECDMKDVDYDEGEFVGWDGIDVLVPI
jgi:ribonuclease BN (tRNA processing enzyme)